MYLRQELHDFLDTFVLRIVWDIFDVGTKSHIILGSSIAEFELFEIVDTVLESDEMKVCIEFLFEILDVKQFIRLFHDSIFVAIIEEPGRDLTGYVAARLENIFVIFLTAGDAGGISCIEGCKFVVQFGAESCQQAVAVLGAMPEVVAEFDPGLEFA